jgi:glutathione S-transferase
MAMAKDRVYMHQIGKGPDVPSLSPFALKLETYLRLSKTPYTNLPDFKTSSKGKIPWIEYNGKPVEDTSFCIEFLTNERGVDLNSHLSPAEKGIARAFQKMIEENTLWVMPLSRFIWSRDEMQPVLKTLISIRLARNVIFPRIIKKNAIGHGIGRHSQDEVMGIFKKDMQALSEFIGDKKFLMGSKPCIEDCSIFGILAQFRYQSPAYITTVLTETYPNLARYCESMKAECWPDWDECITRGKTVTSKGCGK